MPRPADAAALAGFDIAVITVPTPLRDGVPDLTYIEGPAPAVPWSRSCSLQRGLSVAVRRLRA
ncbi:hypothetical protein ACFRDV_39360 [Streptomyces fagopyri]|uniref:hypothetical protein n=1 Tax=Streptomyces fagopyri TaxID=2662397 RepID=UPI0036B4735D